jgi:uncharacterized protein (TIGR00251 family)
MKVAVLVIPNAPRTAITGQRGEEWVVRVQAPALEGRANRAAARCLAEHAGVAPSAVRLVSGEKSRHKIFEISGLDRWPARARSLLSSDDG